MTEKTDLEQLFLRKKPVHLLISLKNSKKNSYVSLLAKAIDCTYSHTVKLLSEFKKFGLVDFKKEGRIKYVTLTERGRDLAESLENVLRKFSK